MAPLPFVLGRFVHIVIECTCFAKYGIGGSEFSADCPVHAPAPARIIPYYDNAGITIYNASSLTHGLATSFDLLLTDPPYGLNEAAGKNKTRSRLAVSKDYGNDTWDARPADVADVMSWSYRCKNSIVFGANHIGRFPAATCWLVWDKVNGASDFADCELAWTNLPKAVRMFRYMWNGMLREQPEKRFHPTQKPLALMKWCISLASDAKSVVDPYMGSGTTLVAAKSMGMRAVGYELEERYCEIAAKRLAQEVLF